MHVYCLFSLFRLMRKCLEETLKKQMSRFTHLIPILAFLCFLIPYTNTHRHTRRPFKQAYNPISYKLGAKIRLKQRKEMSVGASCSDRRLLTPLFSISDSQAAF